MGCCGDVGPISASTAPVVRRLLALVQPRAASVDDPTYVHDFFVEGDSGPIIEVIVYVKDSQQHMVRGSSGGSGTAQQNCDFLKSRAPDPGTVWRYVFAVPAGWSQDALQPVSGDLVGPGNMTQADYDALTAKAQYVCTVQATSKGPTNGATPAAGSTQAPTASLYVGPQGNQQALPCGGNLQGVQAPYDLLVVVQNHGEQDDTFTTTITAGGSVTKTDTIPAGGQRGYTVQGVSATSITVAVNAVAGGTAQCGGTVSLASAPPPPQPGGGGGPPPQPSGSVDYTGPLGYVPVPGPVVGASTPRLASLTGTARGLLVKWGLIKVRAP